MAGKPSSGEIFECKKNAKYKYKLAVRDAAQPFEGTTQSSIGVTHLQTLHTSVLPTSCQQCKVDLVQC